MEYLKEIISLALWPVLIYLSYKLSLLALKIFHKNLEKSEEL